MPEPKAILAILEPATAEQTGEQAGRGSGRINSDAPLVEAPDTSEAGICRGVLEARGV